MRAAAAEKRVQQIHQSSRSGSLDSDSKTAPASDEWDDIYEIFPEDDSDRHDMLKDFETDSSGRQETLIAYRPTVLPDLSVSGTTEKVGSAPQTQTSILSYFSPATP